MKQARFRIHSEPGSDQDVTTGLDNKQKLFIDHDAFDKIKNWEDDDTKDKVFVSNSFVKERAAKQYLTTLQIHYYCKFHIVEKLLHRLVKSRILYSQRL